MQKAKPLDHLRILSDNSGGFVFVYILNQKSDQKKRIKSGLTETA